MSDTPPDPATPPLPELQPGDKVRWMAPKSPRLPERITRNGLVERTEGPDVWVRGGHAGHGTLVKLPLSSVTPVVSDWTRAPPTTPGTYWITEKIGAVWQIPDVCRIVQREDGLHVGFIGLRLYIPLSLYKPAVTAWCAAAKPYHDPDGRRR